ncbi:MAG: HPF1 family protein [Okeania sp. SIO3C4]|nr:HPF1 family protein [Okeania sp. SIO3B3]NER01701.1 HPF1 family protein [Okeania sp. SIO3C4]
MEEKLQELAEKYEIPLELITEAIKLEKKEIFKQKRTTAPTKLLEMIERYTDSSESFMEDTNYGA